MYTSIWFILLALLTIKQGSSNHFYGGTVRWIPLTKNASASTIQVMITQTYTYNLIHVNCTVGNFIDLKKAYGYNFTLECSLNCGITSAGYLPPPILSYCTGTNPTLSVAFAQRTDIVNLTANDYFTFSQ